MTAYAYLRKSSVHDPKREVSYEVQEAAVRALADHHGDNHGTLTILSDWDKSGRLGPDKRPGYRALLDAIESGRATAIYSYSLSRLARSVQELSRLIADCDARGIPVRLDRDHVDTSTASGKLLTNVLSAVAQFESDVASERVRGANAAKLAKGQSLRTVRNYGEQRVADDGEIRGASEDVAAVLTAYHDAGSYSGAAKLLNERGVKPRNSSRGWWPSSVAVVVGRLEGRPRHRAKGVRAGGSDFILARLLICPTCQTMLTGTRDRGGRRVRYSCRLGTSLPHPRISVSEHLILPAVKAEVDRLRLPGDLVQMASANDERRATLSARLERAHELYVEGAWSRERHAAEVATITAELEALADTEEIVAVPPIEPEEWDTWSARDLNAFLRALLSSIPLDPETFQPVAPAVWRNPALRAQ